MKNTNISRSHTVESFSKLIRKKDSGCWHFKGPINKRSGYGLVGWHGKVINAHRLSWILFKGEVTDGLHVLHHCDNRRCINPDHLFLGTHQDNMDDMTRKGRRRGGRRKKEVIAI